MRDLPIVGGDGRKVGYYYTGIIVRLSYSLKGKDAHRANVLQVSAHYAAEAATVLYWSRLSDHIGRKPVLLSCLFGVTVSVIAFGLSRSFWALVLWCFSYGYHY